MWLYKTSVFNFVSLQDLEKQYLDYLDPLGNIYGIYANDWDDHPFKL